METRTNKCFVKVRCQFKSYYVVWKLLFLSTVFRLELSFKSYYVVWKPFTGKDVPPSQARLNRTMQYGNCFPSCLFYFYYICLNRTMQYGNFHSKQSAEGREAAFKSYYVVWKLHLMYDLVLQEESLNRTMQYGNLFRRRNYTYACFV